MMPTRSILLLPILVLCAAQAAPPPLLGEQAAANLQVAAAEAMRTPPLSVTQKEQPAASGDRHDYTSMGPYWWPDPDKPGGLPYIRRDGDVNPESRGARSDSPRLGRMVRAVEALATSWHVTGNEKHARHAALLLRAWFIDSATRMNPHLQYAQAIPGVCDGRGIGLIDGVGFIRIPAAVLWLEGSPDWSVDDTAKMRRWFSSFLDWILTSKRGQDAGAAHNNHGTWHDVQCVTYARFLGREDLARKILMQVAEKRIAKHIAPDGSQPHEVVRTKSWEYSVMNLTGLFRLALLAERSGPDLWNFETSDGRGLRAGLVYLMKHMDGSSPWPHPNLSKVDTSSALPLVASASRVYGADKFPENLVRKAKDNVKADWRPEVSWP